MVKLWVEVCLVSAQGLRPSPLFKLQWFAVGWITPADKYRTGIDASGTVDPVWKTKFSTCVDVSEYKLRDLALQVEVYSREPIFLRESLQGRATIVLEELFRKCQGKTSFSKPVQESASFELQKHGSRETRGFVDVSIRISAEREEPGLSNRGDEKISDLMTRKDGLSIKSHFQELGKDHSQKFTVTPRQAVETLSLKPRSHQPQKFVRTPLEPVETLSEGLGSNRPQSFHLISRPAMETLPQEPGSNGPRQFIGSPQDPIQSVSENFQPISPRQAVKTLSLEPGRNHPRKFIPTTQEPMENLAKDPGSNRPRNCRLISRQAVETQSEDPESNQLRKIIETAQGPQQAAEPETLSQNPGGSYPWNSFRSPRRGAETWLEETGSIEALEIPHDSMTGREAIYHQPPRGLTPPPPPPPSNVGYIPTFLPRTENMSSAGPAFGAEALAVAAVIFGDDFLSGFDFHGGLGNDSVIMSTDHNSSCMHFDENTFPQ